MIGQALGTSIAAKLIGGALLTVVGAFLTAPGRHHRRRIVAVTLLAALLHALRQAASALAAGRRKRPQPGSRAAAWAPASWAAVGLTAVAGFALGSGVTTVRGGWTDEKDAAFTIPDVRGETVTVAKRMLLAEGFQVRLWAQRANLPKGTALRTMPRGGSTAEEGSPVRLIASSGPQGKTAPGSALAPGWWEGQGQGQGRRPGQDLTEVTIPAVEGLTREAAIAELRAAGLDPTSSPPEQSESIPKGFAIRTEPPARRLVPEGSSVNLVISTGPPATGIEVPDVIGMHSKDAIAELAEAGLNAELKLQESESPVETVIATDPAADERVAAGSLVAVFVSSGVAQTVTCEDFGENQKQAQRFFERSSTPEDRDPYGLDPDENGLACG